jgi:hypothetical protein
VKNSTMFRVVPVMFVFAMILILAAALQARATDQTAEITAEIVKAREYTASYVAIAKRSLKGDDLTQAEKLYATAYANYSGWNAYVKTALRDGKAKNLNKDEDYQKKADDASGGATKFVAFVDSKTAQSKAILPILASLADLGLKLWNGIKDRQAKDRTAAADAFEKDTKWLSWNDIKVTIDPK